MIIILILSYYKHIESLKKPFLQEFVANLVLRIYKDHSCKS